MGDHGNASGAATGRPRTSPGGGPALPLSVAEAEADGEVVLTLAGDAAAHEFVHQVFHGGSFGG